MGLDVSIIKTPRNIDLAKIYAVKEAVVEGFPWYLGEDKGQRAAKWTELKDKCKSLTKDEVLASVLEPKVLEPEDLVATIKQMSDSEFNDCLSWIVSSISPYQDGNTHLDFDYDKLPGRTIFDSCSWNLKDLFAQYEISGKTLRPCGDFILEVDPDKVCVMWEKWKRMSFKISVAKWIGYFSERVGFNILRDCLDDLGVADKYVEFSDVKWYMKHIKEAATSSIDEDCRLWLISSY